jgi:hypothetical protein
MCKASFLIVALAALLLFPLGCTVTSIDRVADTRSSLGDLREELVDGNAQIIATMDALKTVYTHQGDLIEPFETFADEMANLKYQGDAMNTLLEEMNRHGQEYFDGWEEEASAISNAEVRKRSMKRQSEVRKIYGEIEAAMVETRRVYEPFYSDLVDILRFLKTDLSEGGIKAIADLIHETEEKADTVKSRIGSIIDTIERAERSMSTERY